MTDEAFEDLKRVCRIRGVPEPTEKPEPMKVFLFRGDFGPEDKATMRMMAQEVVASMTPEERAAARKSETLEPGNGFTIPERFRVDDGSAVYDVIAWRR